MRGRALWPDGRRSYVSGGDGDDSVAGGAGNDTYDVFSGNDTIVFGAGIGFDTVNYFDSDALDGQDRMDVSAFNFANFGAMLAAGVTITANGTTTTINFGAGRPVVQLFDVITASLNGSDFIF